MNDNPLKIILTLLLFFVFSLAISLIGDALDNKNTTQTIKLKKAWQAEAVNVGHAKWIVDKKGNLKFKWLATQSAELGEKKDE